MIRLGPHPDVSYLIQGIVVSTVLSCVVAVGKLVTATKSLQLAEVCVFGKFEITTIHIRIKERRYIHIHGYFLVYTGVFRRIFNLIEMSNIRK
jgi:hypothetical protein